MLNQIQGLHHVTSMAADARTNNRFFTNGLGLRRVKKTVNFDSPDTYHLYYGDEAGSAGTVMTYFPFANIGSSRAGTGEVGATAFSVPEGSIDFWSERLAAKGATGLKTEELFGEKRLHFTGPDGEGLALVEVRDDQRIPWTQGSVSEEHAIRGFHSVALRLRDDGSTSELLKFMGYQIQDEMDRRQTSDDPRRQRCPSDRSRNHAQYRIRPTGCRFRASCRLRRREPSKAIGGPEGVDGHRLSSHPRYRPGLFLGHLFPDARRCPLRNRDQRAWLQSR